MSTRFHGIRHRVIAPPPRPTNRRSRFRSSRTSSTSSLVTLRPQSPVTIFARFTPSDAPQLSEEWFALRKNRLTTSTFGTALGFWKGTRRLELWKEKVYATDLEPTEASKSAMQWGVVNEAKAREQYKTITGREVGLLGFATHADVQLDWVGASPDGLLGCYPGGGILEVKCPFNKGKPEKALPWSTMPFYYMPQIQGQMEIMDRDWVDLYCWTLNGSTIFRVQRERSYWDLIHGILREFWWENVVPAREALLLGQDDKTDMFMPTSTHKKTGLAIFRSVKMAGEARLLCREIAGHVEYFR